MRSYGHFLIFWLTQRWTNDNLCLIDSATMHTILKSKKYFSTLTMLETNFNIISGFVNLIEGFGKTNLILLIETQFTIKCFVL